MRAQIIILLTVVLSACTSVPDKVSPVSPFNLERYMGTWYEIARMPHPFEEGLSRVTATYSQNDDGSVKVINRGFNAEEQQWSQAEGKAKFVGDPNTGHLKVSFFGPFYSSYVVFGLDQENYQYAYVSGYNTDYAWLLAREKEVDEQRLEDFKEQLRTAGFAVEKLIEVQQ
ncbi:lipocalin family protein [Pseudoalteromonas ruthenica]|uniref:Outer membrane lipoprotein Blc n=1 Tax=Pseudoalteromonas ruthenica TaxID=151081 RepID=A0A0F4PL43_9GAMM|nr:lipocalin family protein [Pseudoalteromonas ruthenica]KJY95713.1 lipocalin [Pseudoalteromonas ruthenica]KJZ00400.1 lipocalin [Pseudoalteromonas ruthenica]TMO87214.1 lipocalin [Pseudoalteromonas ruthenica]TMO94425.1 lipocalin [Pseudoalteromonas ruthenica]TMP01107.1 lipocalin [Pseudoalteromonas ruthenica]